MDRWSSQQNWLRPTGIPWEPFASCLAWLAVCDRQTDSKADLRKPSLGEFLQRG